MPQLTELKIKNIHGLGKIERYYDGQGLYLEISKAGSKLWRFKYTFESKEKRLSFGAWPEISLKEARIKKEEARRLLRSKIDPSENTKVVNLPTFSDIALEWHSKQVNIWNAAHAESVLNRLKLHVFPYLGSMTINSITPPHLLEVVRKIEARGHFDLAKRVLGICSMAFRYGVALGVIPSDPCRDLRGALTPFKGRNLPAITDPQRVGELLRNIENYSGTVVVREAMCFAALTFCRPIEIRTAKWQEINIDKKEWIIPAEKMKMRREHWVPLSTQAVKLLCFMQNITGTGTYVFPSARGDSRPMSDSAVKVALGNMGYTQHVMTSHGFRSMASTLLNELGHKHDVIEAQLAHAGVDKIRAIYNRAEYKEDRRKLMQAWADYLDSLRLSG